MKQCLAVIEHLTIPVQYPSRESPNSHYEVSLQRPTTAPDRSHLLSPTMRPATYTSPAPNYAAPASAPFMVLPRPDSNGYTHPPPQQHYPAPPAPPPPAPVQTSPPAPAPAPPRRKRGRPSRTELAKRDLRPLLPQHLMPRPPSQHNAERPLLPVLPPARALHEPSSSAAGVPSPPSDNGSPASKKRRRDVSVHEVPSYKTEVASPAANSSEQPQQ